jgi:hypothetical protein
LEIINLEPPELDWAFNDLEPDWEAEEEGWVEDWDQEDWDQEEESNGRDRGDSDY